MKNFILLFLSVAFMSFSAQAQTPEKFNYQGIARDNSGLPMETQDLGLQISILEGGTAVYVETHTVTTNNFGLYTLSVGDGSPITGTMATVAWRTGNKFIKVEIDPTGGTTYSDLGTTELLSVPYAMYAISSGDAGSNDGWAMDGNDASDDDFIGTTNFEALRFKFNGNEAGFIAMNTAFGLNSLSETSSGIMNTAFGRKALDFNTLGERNTAMGSSALSSNTLGERNTAVGASSLSSNTSGNYNTAFGNGSLTFSVTGNRNTAVGSASLLLSKGDSNTGVGAYSLNNNTEGSNNTAIGGGALLLNSLGDYNTAIGRGALNSNITGNNNIGIGAFANVSTGTLNNAIAIGFRSLVEQNNSLVLGSINGVNNANADTNVGIGTTTPEERLHVVGNGLFEGQLTLKENNATNFGKIYFKNNTPARWTLAGFPETDQANSLINFYYNDGAGSGRDVMQISGQGKVGINHNPTGTGVGDGSLSIKGLPSTDILSLVESGSSNKWGFYMSPNLDLYFNGAFKGFFEDTSGAYSSISDRRLKKNITPTTSVLDKVQDIQIMDYTFKADKSNQAQIGYIAQELEKQFPEFVNRPNKDSKRQTSYTVNYAGMSAVAIKAIQEQQDIIEAQADELNEVQQQLNDLEARLSGLEN